MLAIGPPTATLRKRPSSAGPPRAGRARATAAASPWPDNISAVHGRVKVADDQWTILQIVAQLEIDREQIAMLKDGVEGLRTSRIQDAADHLALSKRLDSRDFEYSLETLNMKETTKKVYDELKGDLGHLGVVQARVEVTETELAKMAEFMRATEQREQIWFVSALRYWKTRLLLQETKHSTYK